MIVWYIESALLLNEVLEGKHSLSLDTEINIILSGDVYYSVEIAFLSKRIKYFIDIDDCQSQPCQNNGSCQDRVDDYTCDCVVGFNGTNCENSK